MNEFFSLIASNGAAGNYLVVVVLSILVAIWKLDNIVAFLEQRKKSKISMLKEALECQHLPPISKKHLEDELASEYYMLAIGIKITKKFQEVLLTTYYEVQNQINFMTFKRALPYLEDCNGKIAIKLKTKDHVSFWVNNIFSFTLLLCGLFFLSPFLAQKVNSITDAIALLILICYCISFAIYLLFSNLPYRAAKKIQKVLAG